MPEKIKFSKQYADRNYVINYDFTKKNEIWVGNYSGPDGSGVGKGGANCIVTKRTMETFKSLLQPPEEFMAKP